MAGTCVVSTECSWTLGRYSFSFDLVTRLPTLRLRRRERMRDSCLFISTSTGTGSSLVMRIGKMPFDAWCERLVRSETMRSDGRFFKNVVSGDVALDPKNSCCCGCADLLLACARRVGSGEGGC